MRRTSAPSITNISILLAALCGLCGCSEKPASQPAKVEVASADAARVEAARVEAATPTPEQVAAELKLRADKGDAEATYQLALKYLGGDGVQLNIAQAAALTRRAADLKFPEAVYWLSRDHRFELEHHASAAILDKTAPDRFKRAEKHCLEERRLLKEAADLGHPRAPYGLAYSTLMGLDDVARANKVPIGKVPPELRANPRAALLQFERAAESGDVKAMVAVYRLYFEEQWGVQDLDKATLWKNRMLAVSDLEQVVTIGESLYSGSPRNLFLFLTAESAKLWKPEVQWVHEATPFFKRAANEGNDSAQRRLANIYLKGEGGYRDAGEAAKYLKLASAKNSRSAKVDLGRLYMTGDGVVQDYAEAKKLFEEVAGMESSVSTKEAQYLLGVMYAQGLGVTQDLVKAHAWFNIAATQEHSDAASHRNDITDKLTPDQIKEAQDLARNWKAGTGSIGALASLPSEGSAAQQRPGTNSSIAKRATGTAFVVSKHGHGITNNHVVEGCGEVRMQGRDGVVRVLTSDLVNDLALLQLPGTFSSISTIASDPARLKQGEDIVAFGYPLNSLLSSGGNLTPGVISATTGLGNNTSQIQITAPIQPGSSGSPVMNRKAEVIAVVSTKLSDTKMAKATGSVGQNVNFAVSGQTLRSFLDANNVEYKSAGFLTFEKSSIDIGEEAKKWTTVVECWR